MLTATYALLTLSVEQKKTSAIFSTLQQYFQGGSENLQRIDPDSLEPVLNQLAQFDESCHRRKVDVYVIPAIRRATKEADSLLAELESLSLLAVRILKTVRERLMQSFDQGFVQIKELCCSMERYCQSLLQRLAKEEAELLPLARRVISSDEWFAIGANFLSLDAENDARKPSAQRVWRPGGSFQAAFSPRFILAGQCSSRF